MTIAFNLGTTPIYVFPLLVGAGSTMGLFWVARGSPQKSTPANLRAGIWVLVGSLVGSRWGFLAVNWPFYATHPKDIFRIPLGGLAWPGAILGGVLTMALVARLTRQPFLPLADALYPLALVVAFSTWLACWADGCAYGRPVEAWWGVLARDEWGNLLSRWPVQLTGSVTALVTLWGIDLIRGRGWLQDPGKTGSLGFFALNLQLLVLSTLRADPAPQWGGYRLETWAAFAFTTLAGFAFLSTFFLPRIKTPAPT